MFRPTPEQIAKSFAIAESFIKDNLQNHAIIQVPKDGLCLLHAFKECLNSLDRVQTLEELKVSLKTEMSKDVYKQYSVTLDLEAEVEQYIKDPLKYYGRDTTDLFLDALGMIYQVNIIVFQSDSEKCEIINQINPTNKFEDTIYFVRTLSEHLDAVVPVESIVIQTIDLTECDDTDLAECDDIVSSQEPVKQEQIDLTSFDNTSQVGVKQGIDFTGFNDTSQERVKQEQIDLTDVDELHDFDCNSRIVDKEQNGFDYDSPTAQMLVRAILLEPSNHEVDSPLKGVRRNKMYTVKDTNISAIHSDDNGKYCDYRKTPSKIFVEWDENNDLSVKTVRRSEDSGYHYNERVNSREYRKVYVSNEDIFTLWRYYRTCQTYTGLTMMVAQLQQGDKGEIYPYSCVVYSSSGGTIDSKMPCLPYHSSRESDDFPKPYIRSHPDLLKKMDDLLDRRSEPTEVFHSLISESGGPMQCLNASMEPRSVSQITKRKSDKKKKEMELSSPSTKVLPASDLDRLLAEQRNPDSPVRTVMVFEEAYVAYIYTDKQLNDIKQFCCCDDEKSVLGVDTTFKLCELWITDTAYRNKRLVSRRSGNHPVCLGPCMFHFSKGRVTFRRFCSEIVTAEPGILDLRKLGVDMEAAIFQGFHDVIQNLKQLYCVRHLRQRDEVHFDTCFKNTKLPETLKETNKCEVMCDLYGRRISNETFERGLADSIDEVDFTAKLSSLKSRWDRLCPGFHDWFLKQRKADFVTSVIQSARNGTLVDGLYYQNDIESQHAIQKRIQHFKFGSVLDAVNTLKKMIEWEDNEELLALYSGSSKYVLARNYQQFFSPTWHSWDINRRRKHVQSFRNYIPSIENTFSKPLNSGRKPNHTPRKRYPQQPTSLVERISLDGPSPSVEVSTSVSTSSSSLSANTSINSALGSSVQVNVSNSVSPSTQTSTHSSSTTRSSAPSTTGSPAPSSTTGLSGVTSASLSFPDPRAGFSEEMELHVKALMKGGKKISKCRGDCGHVIALDEKLVVRTYGNNPFYDKKTKKELMKYGPRHIHFKEQCLRDYATIHGTFTGTSYDYGQIVMDKKNTDQLSAEEKDFLTNLGVKLTTT